MSLLHDRCFILYSLRTSYLDRIQDGVGERVIHIDKDLYSKAWAVDAASHAGPAIADPPPQFNPEYQYSPPIPNFVESDRVHSTSTPDTPALHARGTALAVGELADAINGVRRGRRKKKQKIRTLPDESSDSDFDYHDSEFETDDEQLVDQGEDEDNDGVRYESTDYHPYRVDRSSQINDDENENENDEMEIEELQRAARQIKFSKMPARAKDLIPDVDQMLSTYIQTNNRKQHHTGRQSGAMSDAEANWKGEEAQVADIGLAGNSESKGMKFLQSSSFRGAVAFDNRYNNVWGDISMDENVLQEDRVSDAGAVSGVSTPVLSQSVPAYLWEDHLLGRTTSSEDLPESVSSRDLARISVTVGHVSNLSALIKLSQAAEKNPFEIYTSASGVGELKPLRLKLYCPTCLTPNLPFEVVVKPYVTVADTIGYSLYRYWEEKRKPTLTEDKCDVNLWTLRIVEEDGEPDRDFPALDRTRIISAFSFDEFALVEATPAQVKENQKLTPQRR
ncbi:stress-activated map kinase interacting protein 1-domain-containing protein [Lipomyces chichibuensis]|uniref:stress-activated map kinase interacting protein 1-domain-containing protein n=1 Tax=Lipomyces chichibuensis TaxID=1546026 RepID=UPI0033431C4B